jgi:hypothetical protein
MNINRLLIITSLVALIISFGYGYGNSIILPGGTNSASGLITEINSREAYIRIDTQAYHFSDASVMDTMLKIKNISRDEKVVVYYRKDQGRNLIINIEKNRQKEFY